MWQRGWQPTPADVNDREYARLIAQARWVIEGLGTRESIGDTAREDGLAAAAVADDDDPHQRRYCTNGDLVATWS